MNVLRGENESGLRQNWSRMNALSSQNEEVDPEKVEMIIDPAQETFSLGDYRSVQRRHKGVFGRRGAGQARARGGPAGGSGQFSDPVMSSTLTPRDERAIAACSRDHEPLHNPPFR